ncbi:MAG: hypothetical protein O2968_09170 [Acidobacteria bacterium]|nr:hypothetical protein [Acidobacteriota bacterium]
MFTELVPGEQIHISYLYSPPIVYGDVNTYAKSDEGFAKFIQVELTQQYGKAVKIAVASLMLIGLITMVYLLWELTVYLVS